MSTKLDTPKLHTLEAAASHREKLRRLGKTFVLTNGCFDLLHPGHLDYLSKAAALGDELWIALNSAESVQALKGPSRPIQGDTERAYCLSALSAVSGIIIFDTPRLNKEIEILKPDVYAKAGDYTLETLDASERAALESVQADIQFLPFLEGYSTTALIQKIQNA